MTDFVRDFFNLVNNSPKGNNTIVNPEEEPLKAIWYIGPTIQVAYANPDEQSNKLLADAVLKNIMLHIFSHSRSVKWSQLRNNNFQTVLMPVNYAHPSVYPRLVLALHTSKGIAESSAVVTTVARFVRFTIAGPNKTIIPGVTVNDMIIWCLKVSKHPKIKEFIQAVVDNRNEDLHAQAFGELPEVVFVNNAPMVWGFAAAGKIYLSIQSFNEECEDLRREVPVSNEEDLQRVLKVALGVTTIHECTHVGFRQAIGNLNLSTPRVTKRQIPESGFDAEMKAFTMPSPKRLINWFTTETYHVLNERNLWVHLEESLSNNEPFPDLSEINSLMGVRDVTKSGFLF